MAASPALSYTADAAAAAATSAPSVAATLWITCAVLFAGALLTGLPAVLWWKKRWGEPGSTSGTGRLTERLAAALQGREMRLLSAGLMLGSGLGVVLPEGFFAFMEAVEQAAGSAAAAEPLPEWTAGAALVAGFVGMLAFQQRLESGSAAAGTPHGASHGLLLHDHSSARSHARSRPYAPLPSDEHSSGSGPFTGDKAPQRRLYDGQVSRMDRRHGTHGADPSLEAATELAELGLAPLATAGTATTTGVRLYGGGGGSGPMAGLASESVSASPARPGSTAGGTALLMRRTASICGGVGDSSPAGGGVDPAAASSPSWSPAAPVVRKPADVDDSRGLDGAAAAAEPAGRSSASVALWGLVVHSAADGVAVGAASLGGTLSLSITVAAAIMAHKLPVTFGLTAFLRTAGWSREGVVKGLLAFSASAPLAALITFYLLRLLLLSPADGHALTHGSSGSHGGQAVALALLFSGGTFLAAATQHILPAALGEGGGASAGGGDVERHKAAWLAGAAGGAADGEVLGEAGEGVVVAAEVAAGAGRRGGRRDSGLALVLLLAGAAVPLVIAALVPEAD